MNARNTTKDSRFAAGAADGSNSKDATKRSRLMAKSTGSTKQPIYKGTKRRFKNGAESQVQPPIPRSKSV